jgi:hypothetical protein
MQSSEGLCWEDLIGDVRYGPLRPLSFARIKPGSGADSIGGKNLSLGLGRSELLKQLSDLTPQFKIALGHTTVA